MHNVTKCLVYSQLLATHPAEFLDRMEVHWEKLTQKLREQTVPKATYPMACRMKEGVAALSSALGRDLTTILNEPQLQEVQVHIAHSMRTVGDAPDHPFPLYFNADPTLAQLSYLLSRALRPGTVLETGVAYGATSASILAGLRKNQKGTLYSIDLPPIADRVGTNIGALVPKEWASQWRLYRGSSKRLMPYLIQNVTGPIDLFIHDSANLEGVQTMELETVWPHLGPDGAILMNNVGGNHAFADFVRAHAIAHHFVIEQTLNEGHLTGVILRKDERLN